MEKVIITIIVRSRLELSVIIYETDIDTPQKDIFMFRISILNIKLLEF